MSAGLELRPEQIDALREIGNIGAGNAATSLSQMTGSPVQMGIPAVALLPVEEIAGRLGQGDAVVAAVFLGVTGDAPGHMLFVMGEEAAHEMVDVLLCRPPEDPPRPFDEMGLSVLQEIGNIMTGAYLSALAQLTGLRLEPTPPAVGVDMAGALLGAALAEVAMTSDTALLLESAFGDEGTASAGDFLYIPTTEALATVLDRLGLG